MVAMARRVLLLCWCARALVAPPTQRGRTPTLRRSAPLEEVVRRKLDAVPGLHSKHATLADSDVRARLAFAATDGGYRFSEAMRRGAGEDGGARRVAVVFDVKRTSPHGGRDGGARPIAAFGDAGGIAAEAYSNWPVDALCVAADGLAYGGSDADVAAARAAAPTAPLLYKDVIVDPIQVAIAADLGADAVLLIAVVLGGSLQACLDACTIAGVEAAVECHTPNEVAFALEAGATLLVCTNRDRTTGELHTGQALGLRALAPPNVVCIATGGVADEAEARALALAGYDGILLGRALLEDPDGGKRLVAAIRDIELTPLDLLGLAL